MQSLQHQHLINISTDHDCNNNTTNGNESLNSPPPLPHLVLPNNRSTVCSVNSDITGTTATKTSPRRQQQPEQRATTSSSSSSRTENLASSHSPSSLPTKKKGIYQASGIPDTPEVPLIRVLKESELEEGYDNEHEYGPFFDQVNDEDTLRQIDEEAEHVPSPPSTTEAPEAAAQLTEDDVKKMKVKGLKEALIKKQINAKKFKIP